LIAVGLAVALFGGFGLHLCAQLFTDVLTHVTALVSE
jgi:hypothetical protein